VNCQQAVADDRGEDPHAIVDTHLAAAYWRPRSRRAPHIAADVDQPGAVWRNRYRADRAVTSVMEFAAARAKS